ncbi:flavin-dependent oxidoreductase [Georgenia sp. Z1491]|uniref:flavin-dependent oxidoreductase n=1 Tax=Georgenia sp. Z1491 TaxID=3416707 RepID=UPI003CF0DBB7
MKVVIAGAGIGGLTLALSLHEAGIDCEIHEAAPEITPIGAGINLLPHAIKVLDGLGVLPALERVAVETREAAFFNRHGQFVHSEPSGRFAGYAHPQLSIHRADLQLTLLSAVRDRLGEGAVHLASRATGFTDGDGAAVLHTIDAAGREVDVAGDVVVGADGVHSAVRAQLYPDEGAPRYSGVTMWRGVVEWDGFLTGASMTRVGWLTSGKMVIYPVRPATDDGRQLVNWVAEVERPRPQRREWNRPGRLEDFIDVFEDWSFDWLDVAGMIRATGTVLEYPMVDQDPLPRWSFGRVTLLGDAAHPMIPRGSNGAGQAILDGPVLARYLVAGPDPAAALTAYDDERRPATSQVVLTNRTNPPDTILREVYERTGDQPFDRIEDVISAEEMTAISDRYKKVAAYDRDRLASS